MKHNYSYLSFTILLLGLIGCGTDNFSSHNGQSPNTQQDSDSTPDDYPEKPQDMPENIYLTVRALDEHCRACHGLGSMRFIFSDDPSANWEYIKTAKFNNNKSWISAIYATLAWPSDTPPDFGSQRETNKEWMPIGAKRLKLHSQSVDGKPLREVILETLNEEFKN